ncbi:ANL_HP_G0161870.mRNA.1.CDS.1 [Saccharomyces cerevisiae]|nr:ANL_HP_G0161870.mRNA.1.CDS.1 [Saccharomyces cerevisiae]CAI7015835.1 ANL_HP_G0161870.mRNA.1.CDS.1 [Saccharomyces cerevisiae]
MATEMMRPRIRQLEAGDGKGVGPLLGNGAGGGNEDRFNSVPIANIKHNKDLLLGICGFFFRPLVY